jgi:hypothetical protein
MPDELWIRGSEQVTAGSEGHGGRDWGNKETVDLRKSTLQNFIF